MKTASICFVLALACVLSVAPAAATPVGPIVEVTIDGQSVALPAITFEGKLWRLEYRDTTGTKPLTSLVVSGDTDPFIAYTMTFASMTDSPLNIIFTFTSPYIGGSYNQLSLRHGDSATDTAAGSATITPLGPLFVAEASLDGAFVTGLSPGCTIGAPAPAALQTCFAESEMGVAVSSLATGLFSARVAFTMSGRDMYQAAGQVTLDNLRQVPEPSSLLLIGIAAVSVVRARRRD